MDDGIIDLTSYGTRDGRRGSFALWGAEGERSRLALPVWRSISILDGDRGCLAWSEPDGDALTPFFVLDLAAEPARTDLGTVELESLEEREPPALRLRRGQAVVLLARDEDRSWWLAITGPDVGPRGLDGPDREDLLFLAGECAGLLTRRGLGSDAGG